MPRTPKPLQELLKRREELIRAENNLHKAIANYSKAKNNLLSYHTHNPTSSAQTLPTEHTIKKAIPKNTNPKQTKQTT